MSSNSSTTITEIQQALIRGKYGDCWGICLRECRSSIYRANNPTCSAPGGGVRAEKGIHFLLYTLNHRIEQGELDVRYRSK